MKWYYMLLLLLHSSSGCPRKQRKNKCGGTNRPGSTGYCFGNEMKASLILFLFTIGFLQHALGSPREQRKIPAAERATRMRATAGAVKNVTAKWISHFHCGDTAHGLNMPVLAPTPWMPWWTSGNSKRRYPRRPSWPGHPARQLKFLKYVRPRFVSQNSRRRRCPA
uniref:Putative secreted protein n=1 Tax=Amblyomma triste TaxID=251400 RepID=A0A023G533_AMBTT